LGTSDFSTGVQLTILFSLIAWFAAKKERPVVSGIAWGLSILTKLYALPAFIGYLIYLVWQKKKSWFLILSAIVTGLLILLPFFIASPHGFMESIILHQFHRTAGNDRWAVWSFFLKKEWVLVILGLIGASLKTNRRYLIPFIASVLFFIVFKDLYYLYLAYFFPYLIIFAVSLIDKLWQDAEIKPLAFVALTFCLWSMGGGLLKYQDSVLVHGRFLNVQEIADFLKTQSEHQEIYGSHEVAPILSLYSGKKLFGNYIDTNSQVFAAGTLDKQRVSEEVVKSGVYLVARITDLPEYEIKDEGFEGYFSKEVFDKYCHRLKFFSSTSQEADNYIGIYDCHK
jgi:hypothetical protein